MDPILVVFLVAALFMTFVLMPSLHYKQAPQGSCRYNAVRGSPIRVSGREATVSGNLSYDVIGGTAHASSLAGGVLARFGRLTSSQVLTNCVTQTLRVIAISACCLVGPFLLVATSSAPFWAAVIGLLAVAAVFAFAQMSLAHTNGALVRLALAVSTSKGSVSRRTGGGYADANELALI